jgi:hypothetical protein
MLSGAGAELLRAGLPPAAEEPSLEELVQLNAEALFGGKLTLAEGRFTLDFTEARSFERGFTYRKTGSIASEPGEVNAAMRKRLVDGAEGKFSFAGLGSGTALSNFELAGDFKISFRLRIPTLDPRSRMTWLLNRESRSRYLQTNFFQDILVAARRRARARTKEPRFAGPPVRWFDTSSKGVRVEMVFKDGKLSIRMGTTEKEGGKGRGKRGKKKEDKKAKEEIVEVVALDGIEEPTGGRLALSFDRLSFVVTDLRIEGEFPREWARGETESLRKKGKLKTSSPKELAKKGEKAEKKGESAGGGSATPEKKEREGPDLENPDPEADDEL